MIAAGVLPADVPPDFGYITDAAQKQAQERLARFVPNAKHVTRTNSGHEIHKEQPQLVIELDPRGGRGRPQREPAVGALRHGVLWPHVRVRCMLSAMTCRTRIS